MTGVQTRLDDFVERNRSDRRAYGHANPSRLLNIHVSKMENTFKRMLDDLERLAKRRRGYEQI